MKIYIGLDDSGRGPVIGPMILAGVALNENQKEYLRSIGVKDSKLVEKEKRAIYEKEIKKNCITFYIEKISPEEIDKRINMKINLNKIEAIKFAKIINNIVSELKTKYKKVRFIVIVDCPSNNIPAWKEILENYINEDIKKEIVLIAKHKAERHVYVAAASILAKETREKEIAKIKETIGIDFGSGYPSDPITKEFLEKEYPKLKKSKDLPYFVRETWATIKEIKEKKKQKSLKEFFN